MDGMDDCAACARARPCARAIVVHVTEMSRSTARSTDDGRDARRVRALPRRRERLTARRDDAGETRVAIGGASTGDAGRDGGERDE
jgi:hypothetical protein